MPVEVQAAFVIAFVIGLAFLFGAVLGHHFPGPQRRPSARHLNDLNERSMTIEVRLVEIERAARRTNDNLDEIQKMMERAEVMQQGPYR